MTTDELLDALGVLALRLSKECEVADGELQTLGERLSNLDILLDELADARSALAAAVAEAMPSESEAIAGHGVLKRTAAISTSWDTAGARAAVNERLAARFPNPDTPAIIAAVLDALGGSPKVGGLSRLDIDPDLYRSTSARGWKVTLQRVEFPTPSPTTEDRW